MVTSPIRLDPFRRIVNVGWGATPGNMLALRYASHNEVSITNPGPLHDFFTATLSEITHIPSEFRLDVETAFPSVGSPVVEKFLTSSMLANLSYWSYPPQRNDVDHGGGFLTWDYIVSAIINLARLKRLASPSPPAPRFKIIDFLLTNEQPQQLFTGRFSSLYIAVFQAALGDVLVDDTFTFTGGGLVDHIYNVGPAVDDLDSDFSVNFIDLTISGNPTTG